MAQFLRTALVAFLILIAGRIGSLSASDWPQFLGPERNGVSKESNLIKAWGKDGPKIVWEKEVGEGYSGSVAAAGIFILVHRVGDQEVVEALNEDTGKQVLSYSYETQYEDDLGKGNGPRSTPLVANGFVYALGAEGKLHCLDLKSGKKEWE